MVRKLGWVLFLAGLALAQSFWVETPLGRAEGRVEGGAIAFYGLPYAEAGRFQAPKPLKAWPEGVGREAVACPQVPGITEWFGGPIPPQREDCLVLNVYLPAQAPPPGGFPVMVYIHGGGFTSGAGAEPIYRGHRLAEAGVIVVAPNYRLGPLGFLALPALAEEDPRAAGNYGLLDVLEALRFVRDYIRYFGGDPKNITLFGESAGGMMVCTLLATPEAQGLFQKAIVQSGGCGYVRPLEEDYAQGEAWAKERGCDPKDLACLRALPLERLLPKEPTLEAMDRFLSRPSVFRVGPFKPHLSPLLPQDPREALREGKAAGIPLIAGANAEEVTFPALQALLGPSDWEEAERRLLESGLSQKEAQALLAHYQRRNPDPKRAWGELQTDLTLLCPSLKAARLHAPHAPTYAYLFTYRPKGLEGLGAFHGLELAPLFGNLQERPFLPLFLSQEAKEEGEYLGKKMRRYWTGFAKEGKPTGWPRWPLLVEGYLLRLDVPVGLLPDPYGERCGALEALGLL
ncbi:carboxylic ester hydrolase [Thermus composti]|uniref:Carboxylic ester hydrolase n=1 Tax=Thermus composti TaxID=532059 RepID=A0ABV6PZS2_9DEIN|nr:polyhydroxybutyrate depolymerase [Thermus composti]GGM93134.1 carboxylic ester hydrolase [Thermus composti]